MSAGSDPETLERCIAKCETTARLLNLRGCPAQARVASALAASFKSMLSQALRPRPVAHNPGPPGYRMTERAAGHPYSTFVAAGWTDAQLIAHGYMERAP